MWLGIGKYLAQGPLCRLGLVISVLLSTLPLGALLFLLYFVMLCCLLGSLQLRTTVYHVLSSWVRLVSGIFVSDISWPRDVKGNWFRVNLLCWIYYVGLLCFIFCFNLFVLVSIKVIETGKIFGSEGSECRQSLLKAIFVQKYLALWLLGKFHERNKCQILLNSPGVVIIRTKFITLSSGD